MRTSNFKILVVAFLVIIQSCNSNVIKPIDIKPFPDKNIPEYNFNWNVNKLKDTIVSMFNIDNQVRDPILNSVFYFTTKGGDTASGQRMPITFEPETIKDSLFSKDYFSKPNTANDIYLHDFGICWFSKVYFLNNKPLEYRAEFIIKLVKINDDSTRISIVSENPRVINGTLSGMGPCGGHIARETSVEATSIEEYSLLLFIAHKLGVNSLPALKLPD